MTEKSTDEIPNLEQILLRLADSSEDQQAWEWLYRKMWPWVLAVVYRILRGHRELAEDASQEVFIRLLRYARFEEFEGEREFKNYLYVICQNVGRDYLAALKDLHEHSAENIEEQILDGKNSDWRERDVLLSVRAQEILGRLEGDDRRLMEMVVAGHDLSDVAKTMGLSYENTAVRLHRIRRRLRADIAKEQGFL